MCLFPRGHSVIHELIHPCTCSLIFVILAHQQITCQCASVDKSCVLREHCIVGTGHVVWQQEGATAAEEVLTGYRPGSRHPGFTVFPDSVLGRFRTLGTFDSLTVKAYSRARTGKRGWPGRHGADLSIVPTPWHRMSMVSLPAPVCASTAILPGHLGSGWGSIFPTK